MIGGRGVVLTSEEAIHENQDTFTHWTPNVYRMVRMQTKTVHTLKDILKTIKTKSIPSLLILIFTRKKKLFQQAIFNNSY